MRSIQFIATLNVLADDGTVTGTRNVQINGRAYTRTPTDDNANVWQLHDYRAINSDGVEITDICGADGDAIAQQAATYAANTPEESPQDNQDDA